MKKSLNYVKLLFIITLPALTSFSAKANYNEYGHLLCNVATYSASTENECKAWVHSHSGLNLITLSRNVCVYFNQGSADRLSQCLLTAAQWFPNRDFSDQVELCEYEHEHVESRSECLRTLFERVNTN
jgi:hypothetical protein